MMEMVQQRPGEDAAGGTTASRGGEAGPLTSGSPPKPEEPYSPNREGSSVGRCLRPSFLPQLLTERLLHTRHPSSWRGTCGVVPLVRETGKEEDNTREIHAKKKIEPKARDCR